MKTIGIIIGLMVVGMWANAEAAAPDFRPKFDKSEYLGTIASQVNPWFPLDDRRPLTLGGPNLTWRRYGADAWAQGMRDVYPLGLTTLAFEINEPQSWIGTWKEALRQAETNRLPSTVGMFYGLWSGSVEKTVAELKKQLLPVKGKLLNSPNVKRVDGRPVMYLYSIAYKPQQYAEIFSRVDAEICPMVYLLDAAELSVKAARMPGPQTEAAIDGRFEKLVREYLPYFDGVSGYGNGYRIPFKTLAKVMKDYPHKIFEGVAHFTYTVHFAMSGCDVHLSREWREHLEEVLEVDPDAIMLTNFFDHYENSLVVPCYDREDFVLRYLECRGEKMRRKPFRREKTPELVVTGDYVAQLGRTPLVFEVIGFPIDHKQKEVVLHLDLCDTTGKTLYTFPDRKMTLEGGAKVETFSVPSIDFAHERGVVAHLRYDWSGFKMAMNYTPMTVIDPSIRGYRLYWARSTKNELARIGENAWQLDGVTQGGTHRPKTTGRSYLSGEAKTQWQWPDPRRRGVSLFKVRQDGEEYYARNENEFGLNRLHTLTLPHPGGALHWYNLEMENHHGCKFMTLPIWEMDASRERLVKMNVPNGTNGIAEVEVEVGRVPYWDYPMTTDMGSLLLDESGWEHNAYVRGSGYGGGHLGHTGYNHLHSGVLAPTPKKYRTLFRRDEDGNGYFTFNGSNDYVMVMGGTAFPGSATYELKVRPAEYGREMGILGSGMGQMNIDLLKDGKLRVSRKAKGGVKSVTTKSPLPLGEWSRIAAVYDLKTLALYVNGERVGSVAAEDAGGLDFFNEVILGAKDQHPWKPVSHFKGDIGHVRMTGRNLPPEEFLK